MEIDYQLAFDLAPIGLVLSRHYADDRVMKRRHRLANPIPTQ